MIEAKPFFVPKPFINPDKAVSAGNIKPGAIKSFNPADVINIPLNGFSQNDGFDVKI